MKRLIACVVCGWMLLTLLPAVRAEEPYETAWIRQLGTSSFEEGFGVSVDSSGNAGCHCWLVQQCRVW